MALRLATYVIAAAVALGYPIAALAVWWGNRRAGSVDPDASPR